MRGGCSRRDGTDLSEHWLAMLGDHGGLITVQGDHGLVEGFFGMSQLPVKVRDTAFKYTPEKSRYQCPAHGCNGYKMLKWE